MPHDSSQQNSIAWPFDEHKAEKQRKGGKCKVRFTINSKGAMGIISNAMLFQTKRERGLLLQKLMGREWSVQGNMFGSWAYSVGDHASLHVNVPK